MLRRALSAGLEALHVCGLTHLPWPADWPAPESLLALEPGSRTARSQAGPAAPRASASADASPPRPAGPAPEPARPASVSAPVVTSVLPFAGGTEPWGATVSDIDRPAALDLIRAEVASCTRCAELVRCRSRTVFGVGNPSARLCFVGEAPGADEDRIGEPFVGAAGQLLDRILAACKLTRRDVFILNVLKCRPPQNRTPLDGEMANCWGYAVRQLEIIQPAFLCCLGAVAARAVLGPGQSISRLRGRFHSYRGSQVMVTWHPAYLLRTPSAKQQTWDDMKMLMRAMGTPVD